MAEPNGKAAAATPGARIDHVGELCFVVDITGVAIGAFAECSGLQVDMDAAEYPEGGENRYYHRFRGRAKHPNLILKRGVTNEAALVDWLLECQEKTTRRSIKVSLCASDATVVRAWSFKDAFPVKWQGPTLNAGSSSVATETLEIAHHGFLPAA
jgi:phage tail-like protein